ncbi:unnamed protein product [Vitrella brassicaformis CCMP3155]|uniref:Uncharacterized protein n=2 Tax=Vitrella brassicaformis TaxID=1169539 RepID=A0A0G4GNM0_VITBC|nr:unnamed protein product [Vitrella brassicaformis CCMP3155]|eukprot:CEM31881.1 unnamed protein product [Vitrella brassicaformis CCMP3155]
MAWLPWTRRSADYRRVADSWPLLSGATADGDVSDSDTQQHLEIVIADGAGDGQDLLPDVLGRVFASLLPVDETVRARAVGKAYSSQLIDEAFLWRIDSSLAQQQLTGLIDVERNRGIDPSAPPLPPSLSRLGYLARCAYVIEQAAQWPTMVTFIKLARVCGFAGELPLVLSAESVAAHVPDKASFQRLPAAMAVYKTLGGQLHSDDSHPGSSDEGLQLTEGKKGWTFMIVAPSWPLNFLLSFLLTLAVSAVYVVACGWMAVRILLFWWDATAPPPSYDDLVDVVEHWYCFIVISFILDGGFIMAASVFAFVFGCVVSHVPLVRLRRVRWFRIGGSKRFRIGERDEWFGSHMYHEGDPPVICGRRIGGNNVYPSFSSFAIATLLQVEATGLRTVISADVGSYHAGYLSLLQESSLATESDELQAACIVIDWQQECSRGGRMVVLMLGGGSVVAFVHLDGDGSDGGRVAVKTTEVEAVDGWGFDERFPITTPAVRQLLRRYGLEDATLGPSS